MLREIGPLQHALVDAKMRAFNAIAKVTTIYPYAVTRLSQHNPYFPGQAVPPQIDEANNTEPGQSNLFDSPEPTAANPLELQQARPDDHTMRLNLVYLVMQYRSADRMSEEWDTPLEKTEAYLVGRLGTGRRNTPLLRTYLPVVWDPALARQEFFALDAAVKDQMIHENLRGVPDDFGRQEAFPDLERRLHVMLAEHYNLMRNDLLLPGVF